MNSAWVPNNHLYSLTLSWITRDLGLPNLGAVFLGCEGEGVFSLDPGVGPNRRKLSDNLRRHLFILLSLEKLLVLEEGEE